MLVVGILIKITFFSYESFYIEIVMTLFCGIFIKKEIISLINMKKVAVGRKVPPFLLASLSFHVKLLQQ